MIWINLKPIQHLELIRAEYPSIYKAFELDRIHDALSQETKYTMAEALLEFFKVPESYNQDGD